MEYSQFKNFYICSTGDFSTLFRGDNVGFGIDENRTLAGEKALSEKMESIAAQSYNPSSLLQSSYHNLPGRAISLASLENKYNDFDPNMDIYWESATCLEDNTDVYIPASLIYQKFKLDTNKINRPGTIGLASHPDKSASLANAANEVLEKHHFLQAWYGHSPVMRIPTPSHYPQHVSFFSIQNDFDRIITFAMVENPEPPLFSFGLGISEHSIEEAIHKSYKESVLTDFFLHRILDQLNDNLNSFDIEKFRYSGFFVHGFYKKMKKYRAPWYNMPMNKWVNPNTKKSKTKSQLTNKMYYKDLSIENHGITRYTSRVCMPNLETNWRYYLPENKYSLQFLPPY